MEAATDDEVEAEEDGSRAAAGSDAAEAEAEAVVVWACSGGEVVRAVWLLPVLPVLLAVGSGGADAPDDGTADGAVEAAVRAEEEERE